MPIYVPPVSSIPDTYLPDANTAALTGTSTVGGTLDEYKTHVDVVRIDSNLQGVPVERLGGFSALRYGNGAQILEAAGAVDLDLGTEDFLQFQLFGNVTFQWAGVPPGNARYTLLFVQSNAGGYTVTWPAGVLWVSGIAPTIAPGLTTVSIVDLIGLFNPATSAWALYGQARNNYL